MPLVLDLDGTLVRTDMLVESGLYQLKKGPLRFLLALASLVKGKSRLKAALATGFEFSTNLLPFRPEVLTLMNQALADGREVVLATASDKAIAEKLALDLGGFASVFASSENVNLSGSRKAQALVDKFGREGFDYVGDSSKDFPVWSVSRSPILVGQNWAASKSFNRLGRGRRISEEDKLNKIQIWSRALRLHQWIKNLLLFVPAAAAHEILDLEVLPKLIFAFFAFSLSASAVYLINDLLDLENDRLHDTKRLRPIAQGDVSIINAGLASAALIVLGFGISLFVGLGFTYALLGYLLLTTLYSALLKKLLIVDVVILALLYTLRIVAGGISVQIPVSFWLLAFSLFIFLSLSFVKRASELEAWKSGDIKSSPGRAYTESDLPAVNSLGIGAGLLSVLVFALYLDSESISGLYQNPEYLWAAVPVMIFWVSWVWIKSGRGEVNQDPIIFALKDRASLVSGALVLGLFLISQLVLS